MSNFSAFLTGFLGRTADVIKERKDKAENYFDQSIERARTIGSDQLRQRTDNYQAMLSVANNLVQQAGMPEDLVRTLANEGPQALEEAYQLYTETAAAEAELGRTILGEDFWRNSYDFATEMTTGTDMSLTDFLRQVNGLYGSNLSATTREGGDPFGAFIASGLGLNAMERAQGRLSEYDMGGGYSAADLLAMDARPSTTRPLGETNFGGLDRSYVHQQLVDERRENMFTPDQAYRLQNDFDKSVEDETDRLWTEHLSNPDADTTRNRESFREEAAQNKAIEFAIIFGVGVDEMPLIKRYLPPGFLDMGEDEEPTEQEGGGLTDEITTTPLPPADSAVNDITIPEDVVMDPTLIPEAQTRFVDDQGRQFTYMMVVEGKLIFRNDDTGEQVVIDPVAFKTAMDAGEVSEQPPGVGNMAAFPDRD